VPHEEVRKVRTSLSQFRLLSATPDSHHSAIDAVVSASGFTGGERCMDSDLFAGSNEGEEHSTCRCTRVVDRYMDVGGERNGKVASQPIFRDTGSYVSDCWACPATFAKKWKMAPTDPPGEYQNRRPKLRRRLKQSCAWSPTCVCFDTKASVIS